ELRDGRMASPSTTDADVSPHASPLRRQADAQARGRLAVLVHEAQAALPGQTLVHDLEHHYVGAPAQADPIHRVLVQSQGTDPAVLVHLLAVEVDLGLVVAADPQPQAGPSLVSTPSRCAASSRRPRRPCRTRRSRAAGASGQDGASGAIA